MSNTNVNFYEKQVPTVLSKAILLYTGPSNASSAQSVIHMTMHDVEERNGQAFIKEGCHVTEESLLEMALIISKQQKTKLELLHSNILASTSDAIVWWQPRTTKRLYFNCAHEHLKEVSGIVELPPTVFVRTKSTCYVVCLESDERPHNDTPLLFTPYLNVHSSHAICMGTTPTSMAMTNIEKWADAFFSSYFTHSNYSGNSCELLPYERTKAKAKKKTTPPTREQFWVDALAGRFPQFPIHILPKANTTLGQFIKGLNL